MTHSSRLELVAWGTMLKSRSGRIFGCAFTVHIQTVQRPGVYSAAYSTVHYYEPLKSFEIRVGHSPSFWPPSIAILPGLCIKRRKAIFTHSKLRRNRLGKT